MGCIPSPLSSSFEQVSALHAQIEVGPRSAAPAPRVVPGETLAAAAGDTGARVGGTVFPAKPAELCLPRRRVALSSRLSPSSH